MVRNFDIRIKPEGGGFDKTSLISWWNLEEISGTRNDAHGTNHLTDNNTVLYATGKVGNAAQFVAANLEYLSIVDNASLSVADIDFTFAFWTYINSFADYDRMISKDDGTAGNREYFMFVSTSANKFGWGIPAGNTVFATSFGAPSLATWYFIVCRHDSVANTISISINDGTVDSAAHSTGFVDGASSFLISGFNGASSFFNGCMDSILFAKRVLTAAEITWLYNAGVGRAYSEL